MLYHLLIILGVIFTIGYFIANVCVATFRLMNRILIDKDSYREEPLIYTPKHLYKHTQMNIVFCHICSILINVSSVLYYIVLIPVYIVYLICRFLYWIAHIGRKE